MEQAPDSSVVTILAGGTIELSVLFEPTGRISKDFLFVFVM